MPWGRCDDSFYRHPKVAELDEPLRRGCVALFWMAVSWSNDHLTDGRVPVGTLRVLGADLNEANELVRVGLWERSERAYVVHDWADFNQTKAQVLAARAQRAAAGAIGARVRWEHRPNGVSLSGSSSDSLSAVPSGVPNETISGSDTPVSRLPSPVTSVPKPVSPRQVAHAWLREHGANAPTGWANALTNELINVYGALRIIAIWETAPKDVRTSSQYARFAERELAPTNGSKPNGGHTRSVEEVDDAFSH